MNGSVAKAFELGDRSFEVGSGELVAEVPAGGGFDIDSRDGFAGVEGEGVDVADGEGLGCFGDLVEGFGFLNELINDCHRLIDL